MRLPSGEKNGFDAAPSKFVRRRAAPPARGTTQMSLPYANAISVALTVGERSIRVCSGVWPKARAGTTHSASSEQKARSMAFREYGEETGGVRRVAGVNLRIGQQRQDARVKARTARMAGMAGGYPDQEEQNGAATRGDRPKFVPLFRRAQKLRLSAWYRAE